ncbi:DsbA family oxidoreductase [Plastoroseomonas hellenica]|uniref:DsbA family oxidoreductase n=1 Tax=Plastoroseomonas hellenica TaxID=2687306 RepID=UPI001BA6DFA5|nr:DsbA family oxidoreductase [Plastoroseomonas hellenica]MBR0642488.1 DsbA family oxidoreductase [Plastoroseomonas hellenica]
MTNAIAGHIDIVSDAICPWCWIGKRHADTALAMLAEEGLHFTRGWRPYQLNPDLAPEGVARDAYRAAKFGSLEQSRQRDAEVAAAGKAAGLSFRHDLMRRTPNTLEAHRLVRLAMPTGLQDAVVEAIFRAYFQEGVDVARPDALAAIGRAAGLPEPVIAEFEAGDAARKEVQAEDAALRGAGLSGVPSFVMDRHLLFSGAMPAERMAAAFRHAHQVLTERAAG